MLKSFLNVAIVAIAASAVWLGMERMFPIIDAPTASAKFICSEYDEDLRSLFPTSMVPDARRAARIADSVALDELGPRRFLRRLIVTDRGDHWVVESRSLERIRGGGYRLSVSKCDASVSVLQIVQ